MTTIFCLKKRCRHLFKVVLCEVALWKYRFNYLLLSVRVSRIQL